jgi:hypothetical protein
MSERTSLPECFRPYEGVERLGILTCYFNPCRYRSKLRNYRLFRESLKASGIPCLTVECRAPWACSDLSEFDDVHTVVARDVMWQKERLINLAIARAPVEWRALAWLDCDILFENRNWAVEAVRQLDAHAVVQLFSKVQRLPRGETWGRKDRRTWSGFAAAAQNPESLPTRSFARHGLVGFAWAARREILIEHGLYDACIGGGGDHAMAHVFAGEPTSACLDQTLGCDASRLEHFARWAREIEHSVQGRLSHVPGTLFHLWHGEIADRAYHSRHRELAALNFDPFTDLRIGEGGCWEWASDKLDLHLWAAQYFANRKEDGDEFASDAQS